MVLPSKKTVNAIRYLEFLKSLTGLWRAPRQNTVPLLNENARSHCHAAITFKIEGNRFDWSLQLAYSSDFNLHAFGCTCALKKWFYRWFPRTSHWQRNANCKYKTTENPLKMRRKPGSRYSESSTLPPAPCAGPYIVGAPVHKLRVDKRNIPFIV